jgi:magnesium chelatase subunit I
LTHYPETVQIARTITEQEAKLDAIQSDMVHVPSLAKDLLEQISFEARESEFIDKYESGGITAYENLLSTAERRALRAGDDKTTLRLSDFMGSYPLLRVK